MKCSLCYTHVKALHPQNYLQDATSKWLIITLIIVEVKKVTSEDKLGLINLRFTLCLLLQIDKFLLKSLYIINQ